MADDFKRDFNEVMTGYKGFQDAMGVFSGAQGSQTPMAPQPPTPAPVPIYSAPPPQMPPPVKVYGGMQPPPSPQAPTPQTPPLPHKPQQQQRYAPPPPPPAPPPPPPAQNPHSMRAGVAAAQQNYISNPSMAAYMDPGGMNYASASMMTPTSQGVFRNAPVSDQRNTAPYSVTGQGQGRSLFPTSFGATRGLGVNTLERTRPELMYSRGFDGAADQGSEYARLIQGGADDYARGAGKALTGAGGAIAGGIVGGVAGALVPGGGAATANTGMQIGSFVGAFASKIPGVDKAVSAAFRPAIERRADAIQTQFGSRRFMTGGDELDMTGSGLSTMASQNMMSDFDKMAGQSGGRMNREDIVQITQMAGEQEMLDFASNSDQLVSSVKTITSVLGTMAEITGDPDFKNNMKKMGQMKRLGFSADEMGSAMKNMDSYARMAGMDIDQAMQRGGQQGAAIYNASGQSAAEGMKTGMASQGQAQLAVQAGVFNEQTLALYGGKSGVSQHLTEANAGFSGGPMQKLLPYLLSKGKDGKMGVDQDAMSKLIGGDISTKDAMQQGAAKVHGDKDALTQLLTNSKELTAKIQKDAGPEGIQQMMLQMAQSMAKSQDVDLRTSLMGNMGLSEEKANVMSRMAESPEYWKNVEQQQQQELERRQYDAYQAQQNKGDVTGGNRGVFGSIGNFFESGVDDVQRRASGFLARNEENARLTATGQRRAWTSGQMGHGGGILSDAGYARQSSALSGQLSGGSNNVAGNLDDLGNVLSDAVSGAGEALGTKEFGEYYRTGSPRSKIRREMLNENYLDTAGSMAGDAARGVGQVLGLVSPGMRDAVNSDIKNKRERVARENTSADRMGDAYRGAASMGAEETRKRGAAGTRLVSEDKMAKASMRLSEKLQQQRDSLSPMDNSALEEDEVVKTLRATGMSEKEARAAAQDPETMQNLLVGAAQYGGIETQKQIAGDASVVQGEVDTERLEDFSTKMARYERDTDKITNKYFEDDFDELDDAEKNAIGQLTEGTLKGTKKERADAKMRNKMKMIAVLDQSSSKTGNTEKAAAALKKAFLTEKGISKEERKKRRTMYARTSKDVSNMDKDTQKVLYKRSNELMGDRFLSEVADAPTAALDDFDTSIDVLGAASGLKGHKQAMAGYKDAVSAAMGDSTAKGRFNDAKSMGDIASKIRAMSEDDQKKLDSGLVDAAAAYKGDDDASVAALKGQLDSISKVGPDGMTLSESGGATGPGIKQQKQMLQATQKMAESFAISAGRGAQATEGVRAEVKGLRDDFKSGEINLRVRDMKD